ncbi:ABC transporter substrate-binding protein [Variovorax fucosicus]|uniref:ABC transporter substrate-binding protein n=1 Tax=Variovorax fucosicus TaxID=3053517 RepID=UPI002575E94B|nr:ABC transporter substrate-binding protein [Variovorax sp. J22G47]MDM0059366.1 ABC transporter substrate-binding protein [Variovorax sp. J22G47]
MKKFLKQASMFMRLLSISSLAALVAGCAGGARVVAETPAPLRIIVFPGAFNWPLWIAQDKGFFANEQLAVAITPTPNSTFQMKGLIQGDFDIAMTAMDNVIAYREGQGEAGVDGPDLVAVMGSDAGFLRLVASPESRGYADLRGKTLSVDALTTGYAFVLLELLERHGLLLERDYQTERAGGVLQRYQALLERKHAATILVAPFDAMAQAQGFHRLANATDELGHYQGVVAAVRQGWARAQPEHVRGYIRAHAQAVDWLREPRNKDEALRIFLAHMPPNTPPQAAETAYRALLSGPESFQRRGQIDLAGVETVVRLRAKFGRLGARLHGAAYYYDPSFHEAAFGNH